MFAISRRMTNVAELVLLDQWVHGPLELVFVSYEEAGLTGEESMARRWAIHAWNSSFRGGYIRDKETCEAIEKMVLPELLDTCSTNTFIVPEYFGYTELHAMLASLLPTRTQERLGLPQGSGNPANFSLIPLSIPHWFIRRLERWPDESEARGFADAAADEFEKHVWSRLAGSNRLGRDLFAADSSLRLLAGDHRFWMSRIYRIACERADGFEEVVDDECTEAVKKGKAWVRENLPTKDQCHVAVRAPLMGGDLWDYRCEEGCEDVIQEAIHGNDVLESLDPVLEVLKSDYAHEDFSERYSWVKEDFERSFYSKRAKVKVSLVETVDNLPVWSANEPDGYYGVLFRDILAFFNQKDQHIILALRQGKTQTEIACGRGHRSHSAVSRRVKAIKQKLCRLLGRSPDSI